MVDVPVSSLVRALFRLGLGSVGLSWFRLGWVGSAGFDVVVWLGLGCVGLALVGPRGLLSSWAGMPRIV